jgi:YD repeat-containing protein
VGIDSKGVLDMVEVVAGMGLGLHGTSRDTIGPAGVLGQSVLGQGNGHAFVNAVNGNLVLRGRDAELAGRGTDLFATRTYNSQAADGDASAASWRWGYVQEVRFEGPGTPGQPAAGAIVVRTHADGHETRHEWDPGRSVFVAAEGSRARDELRYDADASGWVWTDGSTRLVERYANSTAPEMAGRLLRATDTHDSSIVLGYDDYRLTLIRDEGSRQELRLAYDEFGGLLQPSRIEFRALVEDGNGDPTGTLGDPVRVIDYGYDSQGRLTEIARRLAPSDGGSPPGPTFLTSYGYDATSDRIADLTHSDGTGLSFRYDAAGRVSAVGDPGGAAGHQLDLAYGPVDGTTTVADGEGMVWTLRHDTVTGQLLENLTPLVEGTSLSTDFRYDAAGNLVEVRDARGNAVAYEYDELGNRVLERDAAAPAPGVRGRGAGPRREPWETRSAGRCSCGRPMPPSSACSSSSTTCPQTPSPTTSCTAPRRWPRSRRWLAGPARASRWRAGPARGGSVTESGRSTTAHRPTASARC